MATLVLTAVGSAIGGPIGGAIGAALGQQVDNAIFAPKPREGARLKELAVQTSSYGTQIPAIFGAMRVAGTVIWATDLIERRAKSGGGKGRPASVNYSYSVSMAVALSSRPIARIGRIWADGNLLRGDAGDLKVDTQLRIYTGDDDQPLDPLMASAEQAGICPAHRGLAYALFEDLQLADYGNRIPSLTFEIFERDVPVPVNAMFEAATGGAILGASGQELRGFALSGAAAKEPLGVLLDALSVELVVRDGVLVVRDPVVGQGGTIIPIINENGQAFDRPKQSLDTAAMLPRLVTLRYYDSDRDFQASLQHSERGAISQNILQIELPAVLDAVQAKQIAGHKHLRILQDRKSWQGDVVLAPDSIVPGDNFLDDAGNTWRIEQTEQRLGSVGILARAAAGGGLLSAPTATPGRNLPAPDLLTGETRLAVIELPVFGGEDPGKPVVAVFASGTREGWRRAALSLGVGEQLTDIGSTSLPAIMGTTLDPLQPHNLHLVDENSGLRVQLFNGAMDIAERTGSPLEDGASYAWLGGEFIRIGNCEALGGGIYRLSRLRRGCFQSENAAAAHSIGEPFVLIEADSARLIEERIFIQGDNCAVEAIGLADTAAVSAAVLVQGLAIIPPAPVHGSVEVAADGSITFRWVRRSRVDSGWRDGVDQMQAEQQEQYLVSLIADGLPVGQWTVFEPTITFGAAQIAALGISANTGIIAEIRQVGRHAQSNPLAVGGS